MTKATAKNEIQVSVETIQVEGSNSQIYSVLLKHTPETIAERLFLKDLRIAIKARINPFKVPVCDPSIDENGSLQFVGCNPAYGYSYNQLEELARKNDVRLGTKNEYILFLATIIYRLKVEGWSEADAFNAVCSDSRKLGKYVADSYKILKKDDGYFWIAGDINFDAYVLSALDRVIDYDHHFSYSVGWFVF